SFTLNTTLARRSTDSPMYPSQGSEISLSGTFTPPYSSWRNLNYSEATPQQLNKWVEYHKWMFDAKYYIALDRNKKLVMEAKAHFGFIGRYSKRVEYTPFERFYLDAADR